MFIHCLYYLIKVSLKLLVRSFVYIYIYVQQINLHFTLVTAIILRKVRCNVGFGIYTCEALSQHTGSVYIRVKHCHNIRVRYIYV